MALLGNTKAISLTLLDGVIGNLNPKTTNVYTLGTNSLKWNNVYATTFTGALSGNASTATKLATPRTINGTNFDGSAAITTTTWGTARNIYISDSDGSNTGVAVSVNGGANATLKLPATIKATLNGNAATASKLATARNLGVALGSTTAVTFDGSANQTSIPVSGTLPIAHGGTGATTAAGARENLGCDSTYLKLAGGTMNGTAKISWENSGSWGSSSATFPLKRGGLYWSGTSDWIDLFAEETSSDNFNLIIDMGDDASPSLILRNRGTNKITLNPGSSTITATTFSGNLTGNATTATKFNTSRTITLTGDTTGSGSGDGSSGWSIATTLKNSGATAGSYGQSAAATLAHSGKFKVPYITVNAKGIVTSISEKEITLPSSGNTDTNVS